MASSVETDLQPRVRRAAVADTWVVLQVRTQLQQLGLDVSGIPADDQPLRALLEDSRTLLMCATLGEQPVGLAHLERHAHGRVQVKSLHVLPDARHRQIGAGLLATGLFAALPCSALYTYLPADDEQAITWARHRGFQEVPDASAFPTGGLVELEIRLDAPGHSCCGGDSDTGGCGCGSDGCAH